MKSNYYTFDSSVDDMIRDSMPIEDIVAVTQFQTAINCNATIESFKFVDFEQHIEGESIIAFFHAIAVVNGENFKICILIGNDEILKALLTYEMKLESKVRFMQFMRESLE